MYTVINKLRCHGIHYVQIRIVTTTRLRELSWKLSFRRALLRERLVVKAGPHREVRASDYNLPGVITRCDGRGSVVPRTRW